jgi:NAD+ diphosphatase
VKVSILKYNQLMSNTNQWFIFLDDQLLLLNKSNGEVVIPTLDCFASTEEELRKNGHSIGKLDNVDYYCTEISPQFLIPNNIILMPLRQALMQLDPRWFSLLIKGFQIMRWNKNHQYCGKCGQKTIDKTTAMTFQRHCASCDLIFYPRISPSIIVRIQKGKQILMARSPHFKPGVYGLIAGFIEPGETAEEAVHREVMEEVGIQIKNVKYFGSQPWPFPDALMLAFTAEYESGELRADEVEIEDAGWYDFDNLPGLPSFRLSVARRLIDEFVLQQKE